MKNKQGPILAFLLPFLIVGALTVWHWYAYGLQDIHTGRMRIWTEGANIEQPGDSWESLQFALIMGSVCGTATGSLALGIYGISKFATKNA